MSESTPLRVKIARLAVGLFAVPALMLLSSGAASAAEIAPIAGAVDGTVADLTDTATGLVGDVTGLLPDLDGLTDDLTGALPDLGSLLPDLDGLVEARRLRGSRPVDQPALTTTAPTTTAPSAAQGSSCRPLPSGDTAAAVPDPGRPPRCVRGRACLR